MGWTAPPTPKSAPPGCACASTRVRRRRRRGGWAVRQCRVREASHAGGTPTTLPACRPAAGDDAVLGVTRDFLTSQGRMKFLRPLYRTLHGSKSGAARQLALDTYQAHKQAYHPIASKMVGPLSAAAGGWLVVGACRGAAVLARARGAGACILQLTVGGAQRAAAALGPGDPIPTLTPAASDLRRLLWTSSLRQQERRHEAAGQGASSGLPSACATAAAPAHLIPDAACAGTAVENTLYIQTFRDTCKLACCFSAQRCERRPPPGCSAARATLSPAAPCCAPCSTVGAPRKGSQGAMGKKKRGSPSTARPAAQPPPQPAPAQQQQEGQPLGQQQASSSKGVDWGDAGGERQVLCARARPARPSKAQGRTGHRSQPSRGPEAAWAPPLPRAPPPERRNPALAPLPPPMCATPPAFRRVGRRRGRPVLHQGTRACMPRPGLHRASAFFASRRPPRQLPPPRLPHCPRTVHTRRSWPMLSWRPSSPTWT